MKITIEVTKLEAGHLINHINNRAAMDCKQMGNILDKVLKEVKKHTIIELEE